MEKKMKKIFFYLIAVTSMFILSGCFSKSPYEYGNSWLVRENDIPQYYSKMDLFYLGQAPVEYGTSYEVNFNWTKTHTNDIFGKGVRVFAPNIKNPTVSKVAKALEYYLDNFHKDGHPFILLAEEKSADLLYKAMKKTSKLTVKNGFIAAYLPDMTPKTTLEIAEDFYWKKITAATNKEDYGVIVTWNCCINNEKGKTIKNPLTIYNINPLTWETNNLPGLKKDCIKAVFYMPPHKNIFWRRVEEKNFCSAVINQEKGLLEITCQPQLLHVVNGKFSLNCISIFAGNIAQNARERAKHFINDRRWGKI